MWLSYATIRQPIGTTLNGAADYDTAGFPDFRQYPRPAAPKPPVLPTPKPTLIAPHTLWDKGERVVEWSFTFKRPRP